MEDIFFSRPSTSGPWNVGNPDLGAHTDSFGKMFYNGKPSTPLAWNITATPIGSEEQSGINTPAQTFTSLKDTCDRFTGTNNYYQYSINSEDERSTLNGLKINKNQLSEVLNTGKRFKGFIFTSTN